VFWLELIREKNLMSGEEEIQKLLDPRKMTGQ
jgi:hypothetical protein